jgi:hypothetical protein
MAKEGGVSRAVVASAKLLPQTAGAPSVCDPQPDGARAAVAG